MSQATKFYLPFFKTGYPNGSLFTYLSGTNTPADTYKDANGTLNTNPILLDDKGDCVLYIDKEKEYRYKLLDSLGNIIYIEDGIKQLNGAPGTPGGPKGDKGDIGRRGVQGISGIQGPPGPDGLTGDKGYPYLTKIEVPNSTSITIPAGVSFVYITATAGGGAGADWSPYTFTTINYNSTYAPFTNNPLFKYTVAGTTGQALNPVSYPKFDITTFAFMPGTGMSGKSVFRQRVNLDKDRENVIQFFIGAGGENSATTLDGLDGEQTTVFLNGNQILNLKGGTGGRNIFPKNEFTIPELPINGDPIRLNLGNNTGIVYFKSEDSPTASTITYPGTGIRNYTWPCTYRKIQGMGFVDVNIDLSYWTPKIQYLNDANTKTTPQMYTMQDTTGLFGENNSFGHYYSFYQNKNNILNSEISDNHYTTSVKSGKFTTGWGAGGDVFWNSNTQQSNVSQYFLTYMFPTAGNVNFVLFNEEYIKHSIINYMATFKLNDSYTPGVEPLPEVDNTSGIWEGVNNVAFDIESSPSSQVWFKDSGFYTGIRTPRMANNPYSRGGLGVKGFAILEYGNIVEHGAKEDINKPGGGTVSLDPGLGPGIMP